MLKQIGVSGQLLKRTHNKDSLPVVPSNNNPQTAAASPSRTHLSNASTIIGNDLGRSHGI